MTDPLSYVDVYTSRTVKPRKTSKLCVAPVVAVDADGYVLSETTGALVPFHTYAETLWELPRHLVVTYSPETWLWKLNKRWQDHPQWSWRVAVTNKHGRPLQLKRVAYYGFRDPKRKRNRYHIVIDANSFFRRHDALASDLLQLGIDIRTFCNAYGLEVRPSAAGIASQLLRHPMFYPFARRRVPGFINESVQPHLPGGHYDAFTDAGQRVDACSYIDQKAAYHYAAMTTPLPNANSVRAIGYVRSEEKKWARPGGYVYKRALENHGLIRAMVGIPWLPPAERRFAPRLMQKPGTRIAHIWTNELPYLESLGLRVLYLTAVWGTSEVDRGLAKYAQWAQQVQEQYPQFKALLLMPYGLLARRKSTTKLHHPDGNDPLILANQLLENTRATVVVNHPHTANALQLGLIQAFVRALSLDMAKQADADGHEIVSIYADGIFVRLTQGKQIPMYAPWRLKEEHLAIELTDSLRTPVTRRIKKSYIGSTLVKD